MVNTTPNSYTQAVSNVELCGLGKLLLIWKRSVYKLIYKEGIIYLLMYIGVALIYHHFLQDDNRLQFEKLCLNLQHYTDMLPVLFVLGFFVTVVCKRWWLQKKKLPSPDPIVVIVVAAVEGDDEKSKLVRRTLLRHLNLAEALTYRMVSKKVLKRYPTIHDLVDEGLLLPGEQRQYQNLINTEVQNYWIALQMFANCIYKTRQEGRISELTLSRILKELLVYRACCASLHNPDIISLACTQVVTWSVYIHLLAKVVSNQYLDISATGHPSLVIDICTGALFTIAEFVIYMGWLKVAEQLINPFGDDDDDFDAVACIQQNRDRSMKAADLMHATNYALEGDRFYTPPSVSPMSDVMVSGYDVMYGGGATVYRDGQITGTSDQSNRDDVTDDLSSGANENDKLLAGFLIHGGNGENSSISRKRFVGNERNAVEMLKPGYSPKSNSDESTTSDANQSCVVEMKPKDFPKPLNPGIDVHAYTGSSLTLTETGTASKGRTDDETSNPGVGGHVYTRSSSLPRKDPVKPRGPESSGSQAFLVPPLSQDGFDETSSSAGQQIALSKADQNKANIPPKALKKSQSVVKSPNVSTFPLKSLKKSTIPPKTSNESNFPPKTLNESNIPPKTLNKSTIPPKTLNKSTIPPKTSNESNFPPKTLNESNFPPKTLNKSTIPPKTLNKSTIPPKTSNESNFPPKTLNESNFPPKTLNKSTIPPKTLNESNIPLKTFNEFTIAPKAPNKSPVTLQGSNEDPCRSKTSTNFEEGKKLRRIYSAYDCPD